MNIFPTATKVSTSTTWRELVPFLRTSDIVTIHFREGEPERDVRVWVDPGSPWVTADSRCIIRHADGTFNSNVTDVILQSARWRADELEPLAAHLKTGDVVRATFVVPQRFFVESHTITLEGEVDVDREGNGFLAVEDEDDDSPEFYHLTCSGHVSPRLRALEVINP